MNFSQWFHETYEVTENPQMITLREMVYSYKAYCVPLYKIKKEHDKNTTFKMVIKNMKQYEPKIYEEYKNQKQKDNMIYNNVFCNLRRKYNQCKRCDNTGYDESGNCLICNC